MSNISEILKSTAHRPYEYPERPWWYYQEWNRALLLHYEVPYALLKKLIPKGLDIDTFNGKAYISIIPFTMERLRPRLLPSLSWISNFQEINVRTYVEVGNKKGVYFLNIEAGKYLSAILTRKLSKLPYEKANIKREGTTYYSKIPKRILARCSLYRWRNNPAKVRARYLADGKILLISEITGYIVSL